MADWDDDNRVLYERFASPILAYIRRSITNQQDAEDLLVEVFLIACTNQDLALLPVGQQLAWLRKVTRNKLVDRRRRLALLTMVPLDQTQEFEDSSPTPEQYVAQQESYQRLYQALAKLSPSQRELVRLRYTNNMSNVAIASILGKSEVAVRQMCSRTLRQLRGIYQQIERGGRNEH